MTMLGIWLTTRRNEFIQYVEGHLLLYEEIQDPFDVLPNSYEAIITDTPLFFSGLNNVIDVSSRLLDDVLQPYCKGVHRVQAVTSNVFLRAIDKYQESVRITLHIPDRLLPEEAPIVPEPVSIETPSYQALDTDEEPMIDEQLDLTEVEITAPRQPVAPVPLPSQPVAAPTSVFAASPQTFGQVLQQTNVFGSQTIIPQAASQPVAVSPRSDIVRSRGTQKLAVGGLGKKRSLEARVVTFSSLTDKAGVSVCAFMFAKMLAMRDPMKKVLYLDLNISNPNSILSTIQYRQDTDATVVKIVAAGNEIDFVSNISLFTETVGVADCSISLITFGETSLLQRSQFVKADFRQFIEALSNSFDTIVVDVGRFQLTLSYQAQILQMGMAKHLMVADGSSMRLVTAFINQFRELPFHFEIVVNKSAQDVGTFMFAKQLNKMPLGAITVHRNLESILVDRIPVETTALYNQLVAIGGML